LLLQILWVLGKKLEKLIPELEVYAETVMQEFDEEAEIMARIWNQLVRQGSPESD
jgi:hypothetical protein